jgi:DNA polymerase III alpha subunit (gram-positive type)
MRITVNVPASSEHVLYIFYDFETTQDTNRSDRTNEHVPNLVCLQQFCSKCENISDIEQDCIQCGKHIHSFWDDTVGDMLSYLCESRPWVEKIIVIAHNAKAFELHFILNRAIFLKWQVGLIMKGMKNMCM